MDPVVVKNTFTFQLPDKTFDTVQAESQHLSDVYEPLRDFTVDDVKGAYKTNAEDADFVIFVQENLAKIRSKGILISEETASRLTLKVIFIKQMQLILSQLKKVVTKLEKALTVATSEGFQLSILVQNAVINAANQGGIEGAATLRDAIAESKTRAIRTAETRKKNEATKKKMEKQLMKPK